MPRSGSTYVSHVLWRTGCLGAPLEYLNFEPAGPYGHANTAPVEQNRLWLTALRTRTSPNGVFGLKGFPLQLEALQQGNPALLAHVMRQMLPSGAASKVVYLRRRDRTAHAISYARAVLSGVWRKEQEHAAMAEPDYSPGAVERASRLVDEQESAWEAMFAETQAVFHLQASEWAADVFRRRWGARVRVWPVGIDTDAWKPTPRV